MRIFYLLFVSLTRQSILADPITVVADHMEIIKPRSFRANLNMRHDLTKTARAGGHLEHEVIFVVKLNNMDRLRDYVEDVSNMDSANYGKHLSRRQLSDFVANKASADTLTDYLVNFRVPGANTSQADMSSIRVTKVSRDGRFIYARAAISIWENMLDTEFHSFSRAHPKTKDVDLMVLRALKYEIPRKLAQHVTHVLNTVQMPPPSPAPPPRSLSRKNSQRRRPGGDDATAASSANMQAATDPQSVDSSPNNDIFELDPSVGMDSSVSQLVAGYVTPKRINNFCKLLNLLCTPAWYNCSFRWRFFQQWASVRFSVGL
jgi:hypothetical protein